MSAASSCRDVAAFRRWFVAKHQISAQPCVACGHHRAAEEFVHARKRSDRNSWQGWVRDRCAACRHRTLVQQNATRRKAAIAARLTVDLLSEAERSLYPGVRYHDLTSLQRLHAYWLARTWWFATGYHTTLHGFDAEAERARIRAVEARLARAGVVCAHLPSPIPPDADDHSDD